MCESGPNYSREHRALWPHSKKVKEGSKMDEWMDGWKDPDSDSL